MSRHRAGVDGPGPSIPGGEWWDLVTLSDPQARVQPRYYAIAGAALYLVTDDPAPGTVTRVSPWGTTFEIRAAPEFTVHWGDGTVIPSEATIDAHPVREVQAVRHR